MSKKNKPELGDLVIYKDTSGNLGFGYIDSLSKSVFTVQWLDVDDKSGFLIEEWKRKWTTLDIGNNIYDKFSHSLELIK